MKNREIIKSIAIDGLFLALIALFTFIPNLGIITIGIISFTTIHIFVLIGAILYGPKKGALYGLFFGILSLLKAITLPGTFDFLFINPFISILPRVLFGFVAGLIFDLLKKKMQPKHYNGVIFPLSGAFTFLHTLLTVTCLYIFGIKDFLGISGLLGLTNNLDLSSYVGMGYIAFIGAFIAIGAVGEIILSIIVVPTFYLVLNKKYNRGSARGE